jgi:hypothetical protein
MDELEKQSADLKAQVESINQNQPENKISLIVLNGDLDKALAAFVIGTGAVDMGMEVKFLSSMVADALIQ